MFRAILWACLALVSLLFFLPLPLLIASQAAAAGDLDASFGTGGKVTTNFGGAEEAWNVALQSDGRIVESGYSDAGGTQDLALARYNSSGALDASFGPAER